jgi:cytochrome c5
MKCYRFESTRLLQALLPILILMMGSAFAQDAPIKLPSVNATSTPSQTPDLDNIAYPSPNYGTGAQAEQIKHGEYLVKAADCIACHTGQTGIPFAGGLGIKTPFGTMYTPNITPDKETGIGSWTDEDFDKAMREGRVPHGTFYYPAFPYPYFNRMTRQDILDIKAYLFALPPVNKKNYDNDMIFPTNIRLLQSFWRLMYFDFQKGEFKPDLAKSPQWNRGKYLVDGPGHCSLCHTPLNFLGAPKSDYYLTGGFVDGYYSPNITSARFANTPVEKIVNVFLKDELTEGGKVQGPMLQVNHDSLRYLSRADLESIAIYLKSVKSKTPPQRKPITGPDAGQKIYETYCAGCHNMGAGGAPKFGDGGDWAPRVQKGMQQLYTNAIKGIGGMPPKGMCTSCSDTEIQEAVKYIVDNSKSKGEAKAVAAPPSGAALTSLSRGQLVYQNVCSICHADGRLGAPKLGDQLIWEELLDKRGMDGLFKTALNGYKGHPKMGACYDCSDTDVIAAVKYMVQISVPSGNFNLW